MRTTILILILVFLSLSGFSQKPDSLLDASKKIDSHQIRIDLNILKSVLEDIHPGLYSFQTKQNFDLLFDSIQNAIPPTLNPIDFQKYISIILARVKCGHTGINYSKTKLFHSYVNNTYWFPFQLKILKNKAYIYRNLSDNKDISVGMELVEINGLKTSEIILSLTKYISRDGNNTSSTYPIIGKLFYFLYDSFIEHTDNFRIKLKDNNNTKSYTIKGVKAEERNNNYRSRYPNDFTFYKNLESPVNFKTIDSLNTAYLTVRTFSQWRYELHKIDYEKYFKKVFKEIKKSKSKNLILDLRGNGGGIPEISIELFSYLHNKSFNYFDSTLIKVNEIGTWSKYFIDTNFLFIDTNIQANSDGLYSHHFNSLPYSNQKVKKNNFKGKIYILMNEGCFSSAGHFLSLCKYYNTGILIGQESAGNYTCNSAAKLLELPNSKLVIEIPVSINKIDLPNYSYNNAGILPDYFITQNIEDLKNDIDTQKEFVMSLIIKTLPTTKYSDCR